jgi:hypothetical protein
LQIDLPLSEVYAKVELPVEETGSDPTTQGGN